MSRYLERRDPPRSPLMAGLAILGIILAALLAGLAVLAIGHSPGY